MRSHFKEQWTNRLSDVESRWLKKVETAPAELNPRFRHISYFAFAFRTSASKDVISRIVFLPSTTDIAARATVGAIKERMLNWLVAYFGFPLQSLPDDPLYQHNLKQRRLPLFVADRAEGFWKSCGAHNLLAVGNVGTYHRVILCTTLV